MRRSQALDPCAAALLLVVVPLASSTWAGLISAHFGHFNPVIAMAAGLLDLGAAIVWLSWCYRRGHIAFALGDVLALGACVVIIAFLGLRVAPAAPWGALMDGGWYASAGRLIDREGRLQFESRALADLDEPSLFFATFAEQRLAGLNAPLDEGSGRFLTSLSVADTDAATVSPWHPPFLAAWLALWTRWGFDERPGAALLPWALAWLLGIAAVARASFGPTAAALAVLLAGLGPALRFYGRAPYAELVAGALALGAIVALQRTLDRRGDDVAGEVDVRNRVDEPNVVNAANEVDDANEVDEVDPMPREAAAFLGGALLALAVLAKVDMTPLLVAVIVWLWFLRRQGTIASGLAAPFALGLALPAVHGLLLALGPSKVYVQVNGWGVLQVLRSAAPWLMLGMVSTVALLVAVRAGRGRVRLVSVPRLAQSAVVLAAIAAAALSMATRPEEPASMARLLAWLITPIGAWAAVAGAVIALEDDERRRTHLLVPLLAAVVVVLVAPLVTRDLSPLYAARRLVPLAVPLAAVLGGGVAARVAGRPQPIARAIVAGALALAAAGQWREAVPLAPARELQGTRLLLDRVARHVEPDDVVIVPSGLGGDPIGRLGDALWAVEGIDTVAPGAPLAAVDDLAAAISRWQSRGRGVLWIGAERPPDLPGFRFEPVAEEGLITEVLSPSPELPPTWMHFDLHAEIHRVVPDDRR